MGIYNTILFKNSKGEHCSIQSKNGDPNLETFEIGCMINVPDGIYFAPEGCFVVFEVHTDYWIDSETRRPSYRVSYEILYSPSRKKFKVKPYGTDTKLHPMYKKVIQRIQQLQNESNTTTATNS